MHAKLLAAVAALAIATPALAVPVQNGNDLLDRLLSQADELVRDAKGAFSVVTTLRASLNDGQSRGDIVQLSGGGDYVVVGVCDEDCSDFDLIVNDINGNQVGSDLLDDDAPMVSIEGARNASYQIQSIMADCDIEPCLTAVRVYRVD